MGVIMEFFRNFDIIPDLGHEIWDFLAKLVLFSPTG
jgi:hypothetical protein